MSGKLRCDVCGGPVVIISTDRWGCNAYRQAGTCTNSATIKDDLLQARVWAAMRRDLLHPDVVAAYLDEWRQAWAEERRQRIAARADSDRKLAAIDAAEARIADAIVAGMDLAGLKTKADDLVAQRRQVEALLEDQPDIPPMVAHPKLIDDYRRKVEALAHIAAEDQEATDAARPLLDRLVDFIAVAPRADGKRGAELTIHGDLATILGLSAPERIKPADHKGDGQSMLTMVAGVGFEPTTFRL